MKLKLIADWHKRKHQCYFCGTTKSVKYQGSVMNPIISSEPTEVCICNRCAAFHLDEIVDVDKD